MSRRRKYYVVWVGAAPGIYDSWSECRAQVANYPGARYKSYDDLDEATAAYRGPLSSQTAIIRSIMAHGGLTKPGVAPALASADVGCTAVGSRPTSGIAVDGACSGNPGILEYRAVDIATGAELFHVGGDGKLIGTNNIAEYLALVHAAALLRRRGDSTTIIYSDSRTGLSWLQRRHANTTIKETPYTAPTLELLRRADSWLTHNTIHNPICKWDTDSWGEIPADFGRK